MLSLIPQTTLHRPVADNAQPALSNTLACRFESLAPQLVCAELNSAGSILWSADLTFESEPCLYVCCEKRSLALL